MQQVLAAAIADACKSTCRQLRRVAGLRAGMAGALVPEPGPHGRSHFSDRSRAGAGSAFSAATADDAASQYISLKQPEHAIPFAQRAVDLNPDEPAARAVLANVLWLAGQKEKSRQIVDALRNSGAAAKLPASVLAYLEARMGEPTGARQLLDQAEDLPDDELLPAVAYAGLAGAIEDWDRLFSWTEEAYGERDVELPYWCGNPLVPKSDPRFDVFLNQMNLPAPEDR